MAYSPSYSGKDLKKISVDTTAEAALAVKKNAPDIVHMQGAAIVGGIGAKSAKKMLKALSIKPRY